MRIRPRTGWQICMLQPHPYCAVSVCYHQGSSPLFYEHRQELFAQPSATVYQSCTAHNSCNRQTQNAKDVPKKMTMQCPMKIVQCSWSKKKQCCNITITIYVGAYPRRPCYTGATHHCHLRYSSLHMITFH